MMEKAMSAEQIRRAGLEAIERALGPVGLIRFLQLFELGSGDYSAKRHQWLGEDNVVMLAEKIRQHRNSPSEP
jgi:hypothetical protein